MRRFIAAAGAFMALFVVTTGTASAREIDPLRRDLMDKLSASFDPAWISDIFNHQDMCAGRAVPRPPVKGGWNGLRSRVMAPESIDRGVIYFKEHEEIIRGAGAAHGHTKFLPYAVAAILRIESDFGENRTGEPVIRVLFDQYENPPKKWTRTSVYKKAIIPFLKASLENKWDPCGILGSRAAAFGLPQFIPSSLVYTRDGDGDGKIDIVWNVSDAAYSVANYLAKHGWGNTGSSHVNAVFGYNPMKKYRHNKAAHPYVQIVLDYARALKKRIESGSIPPPAEVTTASTG